LKSVVLLTNGVGLRNFLCSRFLDDLARKGPVVVWHSLPEDSVARFQGPVGLGETPPGRVRFERLPPLRDGLLERLLRQAKVFAQLWWQRKNGADVQLSRLRPPKRFRARMLWKAARRLGRWGGGRRRILALDRLHRRAAGSGKRLAPYRAFLEKERPDFLFCGDQRSLDGVPALLAARALGIANGVFIASWDNLPKGRMPVSADHHFVWSDFMKRELLTYYPDVAPRRVHVVGTPQFESYFEAERIVPREQFLRGLGLDPARPVVCFSGDDVLTSPHDPLYLEDLASGLASVAAAGRPQILFRRCPVDWSDRYDRVLAEHPEIRVSDPLWKAGSGEWSGVVPTPEDVSLLVNVVRHCNAVVNLGSTMAMDFAAHEKPCVYVAYDPRPRADVTEEKPRAAGAGAWDVHRTYELPHLKSVHELQPVYWASSREDLVPAVLRAVRFPREKRGERRAWLRRHVAQPMSGASERLVDAIAALAAGRIPPDAGTGDEARSDGSDAFDTIPPASGKAELAESRMDERSFA